MPSQLLQSQAAGPRTTGLLQPTNRSGGRQAFGTDPANLCETSVTTAEYLYRLPPRLLSAISLTESGRADPTSGKIRAWPWTINAEGVGQFFPTRDAAVTAVKALQAKGVQSIDVGCLQVNLMYHPNAFASLEEAFDPRSNANYAAHFLNDLHSEGRSWTDGKASADAKGAVSGKAWSVSKEWAAKDWAFAIAAYHSETPALGEAYRSLVMVRWQNIDPHGLIAASVAYGDFAAGKSYGDKAYGAFAPASQVYGAFAPR